MRYIRIVEVALVASQVDRVNVQIWESGRPWHPER
jgi:hypothetical protein